MTSNPLAAVYRAYIKAPSHPAKQRIERWLGKFMLPEDGGVFEVGDNVRLQLHPRDWIEYVLIRDSQYEPLTLQFLADNLRRGQSVMLAGINFGLHVVVASRAVGAGGVVVGVDPQLTALNRTRSHLALNNAEPNVRLIPAALGSATQLLVLDDPPVGNAGAAHLRHPGRGPLCAVTMPAGDLWRSVSPEQSAPSLFLLDVEGFEGEVLAGFDHAFRPAILVVELWDPFLREVGWSKARVCSQLLDLGYTLFTLDGQKAAEQMELPEHNVVAIHDEGMHAPRVTFAAGAQKAPGRRR